MGSDSPPTPAEEELRGATAEGPASERLTASRDDALPLILQALMEYLPVCDRKALLDCTLSPCDASLAVNQEQPCILASIVRWAVCNAVRIIQVRSIGIPCTKQDGCLLAVSHCLCSPPLTKRGSASPAVRPQD